MAVQVPDVHVEPPVPPVPVPTVPDTPVDSTDPPVPEDEQPAWFKRWLDKLREALKGT